MNKLLSVIGLSSLHFHARTVFGRLMAVVMNAKLFTTVCSARSRTLMSFEEHFLDLFARVNVCARSLSFKTRFILILSCYKEMSH